MPSRNIYKTLIKNGYYHIYNRGVEKRTVFIEDDDYKVFLNNLKSYLTNPQDLTNDKISFTLKGTTFQGMPHINKNYFDKIELLAYCLMPNHFHLLVKQLDNKSLSSFMKSVTVNYSMYFNKKYDRVGQLFQGRYKGVIVMEDKYLLHLSRYIHLNPSEYTEDLVNAYSSYGEYLRIRKTEWIKPDFILKFFEAKTIPEIENIYTYKKFVENYKKNSGEMLGKLTLES